MTRQGLAGAVAVVTATVTVSVIEGTPHQLPGVALGSPVLLHAERALALLAVTAAALSILVQATRGRLPIELSTSGLRYEAEAADDAAAGEGRHYVIERELVTMAELEAIVTDYLQQAETWDAIPAAGPCSLLAELQEPRR